MHRFARRDWLLTSSIRRMRKETSRSFRMGSYSGSNMLNLCMIGRRSSDGDGLEQKVDEAEPEPVTRATLRVMLRFEVKNLKSTRPL